MRFNSEATILISIMLLSFSCSHIQTQHGSSADKELPAQQNVAESSPVPVIGQDLEKSISVILGPGGWRYFAHAGVLSELHKAGYKIQFIAGLEKSSLPAMLYADNPGVSQVEWQLFKLTVQDLVKTPKVTFKKHSLEQFQIPFSCASYSLNQRRSYILNRGLANGILNMCYEQFSDNPSGVSFANPMGLRNLIELARSYSKRILYIDLLGSSELERNVDGYHYAIWSEGIQNILKGLPDVEVISVSLKGESRDFSLRQTWMREGSRSTQKWIENQSLKP
jgi:hypothetical protein